MNNIKNKLYILFKHYFSVELKAEILLANKQGHQEECERSSTRKKEIEKIQLQMLVNTPVIYISNEWDNPIIGFGDSVYKAGNRDFLLVKDYVSGEIVMPMSGVHSYSETLLNGILKLTPFEAASLVYKNHDWSDEHQKNEKSTYTNSEDIMNKLKASGFFQEVEKYRSQKSE